MPSDNKSSKSKGASPNSASSKKQKAPSAKTQKQKITPARPTASFPQDCDYLKSGGPTTSGNTKEVISRFTFYDDILSLPASPYTAKFISRENLIGSKADIPTFAKIRSCKVYALPRSVNAGVATSSLLVATHMRSIGSFGLTGPAALEVIGQRTTMIPPTFNTTWRQVAHWNYLKTFKDALQQPLITTDADGVSIQELGVVGIFNADDGNVIQVPVQLMYVVEVALPIANVSSYNAPVTGLATATQWPDEVPTTEDFCQLEFASLANST